MEKCDFGGYFKLIFTSWIILNIQQCPVILKTALYDSLPKYVGVNSRKIALDGQDFYISSILYYAMVIGFAVCSSFVSKYRIQYAPITFILFLLESSDMKTLGLDTKITFLLQLKQKLWHIYQNKVGNWRPSLILHVFFLLHT